MMLILWLAVRLCLCHHFSVAKQCSDGDVRLLAGSTQFEGRLEICYNGQWGTICDDYSYAGIQNFVCKQLTVSIGGM